MNVIFSCSSYYLKIHINQGLLFRRRKKKKERNYYKWAVSCALCEMVSPFECTVPAAFALILFQLHLPE